MDRSAIRFALQQQAPQLGLHRVAVTSAAPLSDRALRRWLARGYQGEMAYLARAPARRVDPRALLPSARCAVVALACYAAPGPRHTASEAGRGVVARFARGRDYHHVLRSRLEQLARGLQRAAGRALETRICVDSAPLLERALAVRAGLGFIGKNTMLVTPGLGSYTVIGVLLTDLELAPDAVPTLRGCGRCRLCLDVCPTCALEQPYLLDARRCLSTLTIEQRGPAPADLRPAVVPWIFGCDACQEVCPHNARAGQRPGADDELTAGETSTLELAALLPLRSGDYRRLVRGRALSRTSRLSLMRNAALVLGGQHRAGLAVADLLRQAAPLTTHSDEGVRQAVRWALGD